MHKAHSYMCLMPKRPLMPYELHFAQVGTPICIPHRDFINIDRIASIQKNRSSIDIAKKGQEVAIMVRDFYLMEDKTIC